MYNIATPLDTGQQHLQQRVNGRYKDQDQQDRMASLGD